MYQVGVYLPRLLSPVVGALQFPVAGVYVVRCLRHVVLNAVYEFALRALRVATRREGTHDPYTADWFIRV